MKGVVIVVKYPNKFHMRVDDATFAWLSIEADAQHRPLTDYVRHIILVYKNAKEAKNKKGV